MVQITTIRAFHELVANATFKCQISAKGPCSVLTLYLLMEVLVSGALSPLSLETPRSTWATGIGQDGVKRDEGAKDSKRQEGKSGKRELQFRDIPSSIRGQS